MNVLVDSDVLIDVSRGRDADVIARWLELSGSDAVVFYSPVSVAELWAGALPREHAVLARLFAALRCAPIDAEAGRRAGEYLNQFRASHRIEVADALIAAGAVGCGAELWTRNRKHYPMAEIGFFSGG